MKVLGLKAKVSKFIVVTMASALIISSMFTDMGVKSEAGTAGNTAFLGDYAKYGIIANELNQTAHMQTNFLVGVYVNNGQFTGADLSHSTDGGLCAGEIHVGEAFAAAGVPMSAEDLQGRLNGGAKDTLVLVDPNVKTEVASALATVTGYADSIVSVSSGDHANVLDTTDIQLDMNNTIIDASQIDNPVVYVWADPIIDAINTWQIQSGGLKIHMKEGQTVIMNTTRGEVSIPQYSVNIVNGSLTQDQIAENVIWNMPNASTVTLRSDNMRATVIAPRASVNLETTSEGWLVCNRVAYNNGEWHFISSKVPRPVPPEPTPEPTPEITPEPTPEPTPEVTPEPTPTPEVTPEPTPTPEVTPEPTPTPEVTP
ncbi:MAG: choice-of-anchor A family protein, partial [Acetatifactor sp.]|nr:choice-of-anchor A family protein [Acetatifactor sp.]